MIDWKRRPQKKKCIDDDEESKEHQVDSDDQSFWRSRLYDPLREANNQSFSHFGQSPDPNSWSLSEFWGVQCVLRNIYIKRWDFASTTTNWLSSQLLLPAIQTLTNFSICLYYKKRQYWTCCGTICEMVWWAITSSNCIILLFFFLVKMSWY